MRPKQSLSWRRHRRFVVGFALAVAATVVLFGEHRVSAITSSERASTGVAAAVDVVGRVPLFDDGVVHEIEVEYVDSDYQRLLETFQHEGTKESIEARVTIDGTTLERVGMRLKGNSTLFPLGGHKGRGAGPIKILPAPAAGEFPPGGPGKLPPAGGFGKLQDADVSADEPQGLPWLLDFDEYVPGRRYDGFDRIAIRPRHAAVTPETALNEAISLKLIGIAGEPAEKTMYSSFSVNGSKAVVRLVVEEPGRTFAAENFAHEGVLYKSLSTGGFDYLGDDPLDYANSFDQVTRKKQQDLRPLIRLLQWVSDASDAEFAAELDAHVDVHSFARYVALQNLLLNWDDMAGPGQNYYLWYDLEEERFSVVTWDMNLSFSGDAGQGRLDQGRPGGHGPDPAGVRLRERHLLKERFLANGRFRAIYLTVYDDLYEQLFASGRAVDELDRLESVVAGAAAADRKTVEREAATLRSLIRERTAALAG